jgi:MoaA/NifB/PqqE/SkfB family radical SAM enzyme
MLSLEMPPSLPIEMPIEGTAWVDEAGRLVLPADVIAHWGLRVGDRLRLSTNGHRLSVTRSPHHLMKLYVEPTTVCNLACRMCVRNIWHEPIGHMALDLYEQVLDQARAIPELRLLSFGGIGEPLTHPHLPEMVARAKAQGLLVELVTNGTLLESRLSRALIEAGLDLLWVSIDGTTPAAYDDVRGTQLQVVLDHLSDLHQFQHKIGRFAPQLGLVFVAMKRNLTQLPHLRRLARHVGAARVMVTNVLPYTRELADEILYGRALYWQRTAPSSLSPQLSLPNLDWDAQTGAVLVRHLRFSAPVHLTDVPLEWSRDTCRFIQQGCVVIGQDGRVAPCMGLLHSYTTYLHGYERQIRAYSLGNIANQPLFEIWRDPEYRAFRERVSTFDFSPCTMCGGCDHLESNETDCFGSPFPSCGGCLWAQGIVQCP